ncbi:MAG: hypothetical protein QG622_1104 [Actinomycetota bacterium]|nr:hypothetical protein [Actinomycetota bacterium]
MTDDPFATGRVRERVLSGWSASPVRFREDANAEEDYALGGYRDRLVVELAQNAADAATRAGVPGRLLLAVRELDGRAVLVAANTGAPLTAEGISALATLRASDKRDEEAVGRFGVGFSSVLSVTDEPAVVSRTGGVRFSSADTAALVRQHAAVSAGLGEELARRDGHVPVLRLPFPAEGVPPVGYDTVVLLPLRDAAAEDLAVRLLDEVDDALLLALPALTEVVVERPGRTDRCLTDVGSRWHVVRRQGGFAADLLADRPTEERRRTSWALTWALPRERGPVSRVLHAPTPTDEPLDLPALLIAPFPLDPGRRHVAPGPATDTLVEEAAHGYADLLRTAAGLGLPVWPLVPAGLAGGSIDAALRDALRRILPTTPLLTPAERPAGRPDAVASPSLLRPRDAVVLEPPAGADPVVVEGLAPYVAGLVLAPRSAAPALDLLGVRRLALADIVEQLPALPDAGAWLRLYAALAGLVADPLARESLASLPVPLADGRLVRGVRGLVLPVRADAADGWADDGLGDALATLGVRVVDPDAAHPLLEHLGAVPLEPRAALELPAVRVAVVAADDEDDPDLRDAVLTVAARAVADGRLAAGDLPWLGDLPLPDAEDDVTPASLLALPGSFAAEVLDPDDIALVAEDVVKRWGADVLVAVGVLDTLAVLRLADVPVAGPGSEDLVHLGDDPAENGPQPADLDGWQDWADEVTRRATVTVTGDDVPDPSLEVVLGELVAIRDLDAVREEAWPLVVTALSEQAGLRSALLDPVRVSVRGPGVAGSVDVPSYSSWWLCRSLAGGPWADPDADPSLASLLPPAPEMLAPLDPAVRRALGAVGSAAQLDAAAVEAVLAGMADPDVDLDAATAISLWRELAAIAVQALADGTDVAPPAWVRVLDGPDTRVVRVQDAVVVDGPAWLQRTDLGGAVIAPDPEAAPALADLLDVALAGELAPGVVADGGQPVPVPSEVGVLLPGAPASWFEHDDLLVDGVDVDWWVEGRGPSAKVHATTFEGLARGLAWAAEAWHRRGTVLEVLTEPTALPSAVVDEAFGGPSGRRGQGSRRFR